MEVEFDRLPKEMNNNNKNPKKSIITEFIVWNIFSLQIIT